MKQFQGNGCLSFVGKEHGLLGTQFQKRLHRLHRPSPASGFHQPAKQNEGDDQRRSFKIKPGNASIFQQVPETVTKSSQRPQCHQGIHVRISPPETGKTPEVKIPSGKHHRQSKKELEPTSRLCRKTRKQVFRKRQSQHRHHCQDEQGKGKNQGYAETFFRFHQCFLVRIQGLFYGFLLQHPSWMKTCLPDCVFDQSRFNSIGIIPNLSVFEGQVDFGVFHPDQTIQGFFNRTDTSSTVHSLDFEL